MNALRIALAAMIISSLAIGCKKKNQQKNTPSKDTAKLDSVEKFKAEYKKRHAKGVDEVWKLVYKNDQVPEDMVKPVRMTIATDADATIEALTAKSFEDPNYAQSTERWKKKGMVMPVKPTHELKVSAKGKDGMNLDFPINIAKVDGSFYIIAPIKAK